MKKKIQKNKYTDENINAEVIEDFLPSPDQLVPREESIKVTLTLSRKSVDFFKEEAQRVGAPYQTMIRALIDRYSQRFS